MVWIPTPGHDRTQRYQTVSFKTVTVDDRGQVISRDSHTAQQVTETLQGGVALELILIPGGAFWMGSRAGIGYDDETPRHRVSVPPFLMGKVPVTQAQWAAVMDWTPPYRCTGALRPADRVSWHDAMAFCARLSEQTGRGYRLPSEAEWEYACRAGTRTPFYVGENLTTDLANYVGLHTYDRSRRAYTGTSPTDVATFPPIPSGSTTCTATSGSGARTPGTRATKARRRTAAHGSVAAGRRAYCAEAAGTTRRRSVVAPRD